MRKIKKSNIVQIFVGVCLLPSAPRKEEEARQITLTSIDFALIITILVYMYGCSYGCDYIMVAVAWLAGWLAWLAARYAVLI